MFKWIRRKASDDAAPPQNNPDVAPASQLSCALADNIASLDALFTDVDIMRSRRFQNASAPGLDFCIYFSDGVVDSLLINEHIIAPLLVADIDPGPGLFEAVRNCFVMTCDMKETTEMHEIVSDITYGDTLLLIEGSNRALIISSKSFMLRSITEPEGEKVLSGPREGFNEGLMANLSMIRRRLRTNELKMRFYTAGAQTNTTLCICYMDNIVNKNILNELYRRLETVNIDGVIDSNYIAENIQEGSLLGFVTTGTTERPDVVAAKLLGGRIAIVVDGSPVVLTIPYLFIENFQSNEDYYVNPYYATFSRMLRIIGFFLTMITPALYIAISAYHHEILPAPLMINITSERQSVPLSAALEAFIMLLVFDILRETGVRMPSHVGQALSIVGALVIGQAAVEAKLVASPMIIVVAFTGITNLLVPKLSAASLVARYLLLLLASSFGLLGVVCGLSILIIHVFNLQSYGVPALMPLDNLSFQEVKDTFFRAPLPKMLTRVAPLSSNRTRARTGHVGDNPSQKLK
ncbi:MAG: spore germination protein [Oscillospiraceae bacterium]|jgi:spore germination protein KA|nr:spore germination protein [Oscillospiraceae bacterium]